MRIGVDIVDCNRLQRILEKTPAFLEANFTPSELEISWRRSGAKQHEFLAGRLAVKEAVLKAFGTGINGDFSLLEIETLHDTNGAPVLGLRGTAAKFAQGFGMSEYKVSISHEADLAIAFVVLHGKNGS